MEREISKKVTEYINDEVTILELCKDLPSFPLEDEAKKLMREFEGFLRCLKWLGKISSHDHFMLLDYARDEIKARLMSI